MKHIGLLQKLLFLIQLSGSTGEIDLVGNVIISDSPLEIQSRSGVFLLENLVIPEPAAILKFKTYVVGPEVIWFQLWRPASMEQKRYTLITQIWFAAERYPEIKNIDVSTEEPIIAQSGDVIGLFHESETIPISYRFKPQTATFYYTSSVEALLVSGDTITFGDLPYPYEFSVQVYYDTDYEKYIQTQPTIEMSTATESDLQNTRTESTNTPGDMHNFSVTSTQNATPMQSSTEPDITASADQFHVLGGDFITESATNIFSNGGRRTIIFGTLSFPMDATIVGFQLAVVSNGPVYFQVWRRLSDDNGRFVFRLVKQRMFMLNATDELIQHIMLPSDDSIQTQEGDVIGFTNPDDACAIGYKFTANRLHEFYLSMDGVRNIVGEDSLFDRLSFPYQFGVAVIYEQSQDETTSSRITTDLYTTAADSPYHTTTRSYEPLALAAKKCSKDDEKWFNNSALLLGLLIWLIVLTIAFIALLVYAIYAFRYRKTLENKFYTGTYMHRKSALGVVMNPRAYDSQEYLMSSEYLHFPGSKHGNSKERSDSETSLSKCEIAKEESFKHATASKRSERDSKGSNEVSLEFGTEERRESNLGGRDSDSAYENSLIGNTNEALDLDDVDVYDIVDSKL